jgi:hypothetical protein
VINKSIHFEDVWVSAEKACETTHQSIDDSIKSIIDGCSNVEQNPEYFIGQMLLHLSNLSRHYQVNTWDALQKASTDALVEYYEP